MASSREPLNEYLLESDKQARIDTPIGDLSFTNNRLKDLSPLERINWAAETFNIGLYALTSAGVDSAYLIDHVARANQPVQVIHINTGFLPEETLEFRHTLESIYNFKAIEVGPSQEEIDYVKEQKLWLKDIEQYSQITKIEPLNRAIGSLGITALLTGIRGDQTANRSSLSYINYGQNGEFRISPFIDVSTYKVNRYITENHLPRNTIYYQGYGSVEDKQTMVPGVGREGRVRNECGLHNTKKR